MFNRLATGADGINKCHRMDNYGTYTEIKH